MKNWRRIFVAFLCVFFIALSLPTASAIEEGDSQYINHYADGSYTVTTITSEEPLSTLGQARGAKGGTKKTDYYSKSNELLWTFRIHGTFTYDGRSAEATSADYSHDIYNSAWSFNSGSAYCSGATATANGNFSLAVVPNSVTLSLTCSANGTLS